LSGQPPEREWTWDRKIPRGYVTSLFADGGAVKTLLAQQLATVIAAGCGELAFTVTGHSLSSFKTHMEDVYTARDSEFATSAIRKWEGKGV
jgi:hypothetical protein